MFLETSALTGENVEETFLKCARSILTKVESGLLSHKFVTFCLLQICTVPCRLTVMVWIRWAGSRANGLRHSVWRRVIATDQSATTAAKEARMLVLMTFDQCRGRANRPCHDMLHLTGAKSHWFRRQFPLTVICCNSSRCYLIVRTLLCTCFLLNVINSWMACPYRSSVRWLIWHNMPWDYWIDRHLALNILWSFSCCSIFYLIYSRLSALCIAHFEFDKTVWEILLVIIHYFA